MSTEKQPSPGVPSSVCLIVADPALRAAMERWVSHAADLVSVGTFASLEEARSHLPRVRPALVVLEEQAAGGDLAVGIRQLKAQAPGVGFVVVAARPRLQLRARLGTTPAEAVLDTTCLLPRRFLKVLRHVRDRSAAGNGPGKGLRLTPRQAEIAALIARGWPDKQIAHALRCSEETVGWHLKQIFRRNGLHTRAELAARFAEERRSG